MNTFTEVLEERAGRAAFGELFWDLWWYEFFVLHNVYD